MSEMIARHSTSKGAGMESTYKIVELVGSSPDSWERAAQVALEGARQSLRDLRIAEVEALDIHIDETGNILAYRTKLKVSFKYQSS
jgi:flavin-binding protein dodecin